VPLLLDTSDIIQPLKTWVLALDFALGIDTWLLFVHEYPSFAKKSQTGQAYLGIRYVPGCVIQLLVLPLRVIRPQHITNGVMFAGEYVMQEAKANPPIVVET